MRFMLRHPIQHFVTLRAFPMTKRGQRRRLAKRHLHDYRVARCPLPMGAAPGHYVLRTAYKCSICRQTSHKVTTWDIA